MPQKKLLLVLLFFLVSTKTSFAALDPIIITDSIKGSPQGTGQDYNYHSNNILNTTTIDCSGSIPISNTFDPIRIGIDANSEPIFQTQSINQISGTINISENYTNRGVKSAYNHFVGNPLKIYGDDQTLNQTFLSLKINNPYGSSGIANRSTPYRVLQCQKSQRLIYAIESLNPESNSVYDNEHIGWNCSGQIFSVIEKKDGSGCTPIRLADIAAALASDDIFYPTSIDCSSPDLPEPSTLPVTIPNPNPVSHDVAQKLFVTAVTPVSGGSLASNVEVCDKDASGNPINCQQKKQSIPLGSITATNQDTANQLISNSQTITNYDICQTANRSYSADRPNPLSFIAKVIKFFGEVTDTAKTFTDSTTKTIHIDSRVNIDQDQAFLNNLIPASVQSQHQSSDQRGSSTDGKIIQPGNPVARSVFADELLPANF